MKKFWLVTLMALVLLLAAATVSAQEGTCIARGVYYQACFVADNRLEVLRIEGGQGVRMGFIPGEIYPYAATNLDSPQLVYTLADGSGYYLEVYFTGKILAPVNGYDTTWTLVFYGPAGRLSSNDYTKRAAADPTVSLPFSPPAAGARPQAAAPAAAAPAAAPVVTNYEPTIVQGGTVENCRVRATYTVRMRQAPSTGSAVLAPVPYATTMPADMITTDGQWVRAFFVGEGGTPYLGWIFARYLDLSEACEGITTVAPLGGAVTAPVAAAPAADAQEQDDEPSVLQGEDFDPTFGGQLDLSIVEPGSVSTCLVRTTYTVRMRAMPNTGSPELDNVPYQSSMPADLVTSDGEWVRANYLGSLGWINSRYLSLSEACEGLAAIAPAE